MSPNVGNFVHDLVEMAKAMETLPQVQAELDRANAQIEQYAKQVQDREIAIISYKERIEELNNKVRSLEVERDDASFRSMELEDTIHVAVGIAKTSQEALNRLIEKLDPPKPQPEKAVYYDAPTGTLPNPNPATFTGFEPQGQGEGNPIGEQQVGSQESRTEQYREPTSAIGADTGPNANLAEAPKSDENPTAKGADTSLETASSTSANIMAADTNVGKGPYEGKLYHDISNYISRSDWLAGGGTEQDYDWRPSYKSF